MPELETIEFGVDGAIAHLRLNRPDAGNAMNLALVNKFAQAALACDNNPAVKAVLLSATGKMFCAGGDLNAFEAFGEQAPFRIKEMADTLHKGISVLARMSAPLVVAVNGVAAGGGFSLAMAGDYVIAGEAARFTMAYTAAGLSPDGSASYFLPRLVGVRRTQELMYTNRVLSAQEALDWGLITRVVSNASLADEAMAVCRKLAAGSARANAAVKKLLLLSSRNGLEEQMEIEGREIARNAASPDGIEGIRAFLEKRPPRFR